MKTFITELKNICKEHNITLVSLANKIGVNPTQLHVVGNKKGISYNKLNEIIKLLKAGIEERYALRRSARFTTPRDGLMINDDFIDAVTTDLIANDFHWDDYKQVCKTVLRFAGVKTKVKKD